MKKRITLFCAFLLIGISLAIAQAVQVTGLPKGIATMAGEILIINI